MKMRMTRRGFLRTMAGVGAAGVHRVVVVSGEQRLDEMGDGMAVEIGGDIADAQRALRIARVAKGRRGRGERVIALQKIIQCFRKMRC